MSIRCVHVTPETIGPYVESLRALEHDIEYPIADGADFFRIDHGALYHPFFSEIGEAHFILALDGDRVVATVAGILREVVLRGRVMRGVYGADMKVAASHRGRDLSRRMLWFGLRNMTSTPGGMSWRYGYVAAMRGARGDVTRTVRGVHPGKIARPAARLAVYFARPELLAALDVRGAPASPSIDDGLDLSPPPRAHLVVAPGLVSTAGRKDLRLRSTGGASWPLVHLPRSPAQPRDGAASWPRHIAECGAAMLEKKMLGPACFAVDLRLREHVAWLASHGIEAGAVCTVYALSLTLRSRGASWLHLATSEI